MNDLRLIEDFDALVSRLNNTSGTKAKVAELAKVPDGPLRELIKRIWDPQTTTGVTAKNLASFPAAKATRFEERKDDLLGLLDLLTSRGLSGDAAKAACIGYANRFADKYRGLLFGIFEKNPRVRMGTALILEAFPNLFQVFKVALAKEFTQEIFDKQVAGIAGTKAFISRKYDGVRTICIVSDHGRAIKFYSREGNEFSSLEKLRTDIAANIIGCLTPEELAEGVVFDGEVMDGTETFKLSVSQIKRIGEAMPNPRYYVFDFMRLSVFYGTKKGDILEQRIEDLADLVDECKRKPQNFFVTEQLPYTDENLRIMRQKAIDGKWEGNMVRVNTFYEAKRTNNLLKLKFQSDAEYKVVDVVLKDMPFPNDRGGETIRKALNSVVIEHKGFRVHVGSGFSTEERLDFAAHPEKILSKEITVKYQEEFYDPVEKTYSLRCPIFKVLHSGERRTE